MSNSFIQKSLNPKEMKSLEDELARRPREAVHFIKFSYPIDPLGLDTFAFDISFSGRLIGTESLWTRTLSWRRTRRVPTAIGWISPCATLAPSRISAGMERCVSGSSRRFKRASIGVEVVIRFALAIVSTNRLQDVTRARTFQKTQNALKNVQKLSKIFISLFYPLNNIHNCRVLNVDTRRCIDYSECMRINRTIFQDTKVCLQNCPPGYSTTITVGDDNVEVRNSYCRKCNEKCPKFCILPEIRKIWFVGDEINFLGKILKTFD